jgi:hypothetical protein
MTPHSHEAALRFALPGGRIEPSVLFAVRRMAAHGLRDVSAAWLMLDLFSTGFRRPLVLLRAFMLELAHAATGPIRVAPCCAPRMTEHERWIILALFRSADDLASGEDALAHLTGRAGALELLSAAAVFARSVREQALRSTR